MSLKTYNLTIVFDDQTDTVEYIEEEMTEDTSGDVGSYLVEIDPEMYDDELIKKLIKCGIIGES